MRLRELAPLGVFAVPAGAMATLSTGDIQYTAAGAIVGTLAYVFDAVSHSRSMKLNAKLRADVNFRSSATAINNPEHS